MTDFFTALSASDVIQLLGIIISLVTSVVAIIISVLSLKQNSKMIADSTRPYIGVYGSGTYVSQARFYIIVKNFGQSSAHIDDFKCDIDLSKYQVVSSKNRPFQHIQGTTFMPGQSFRCVVDFNKIIHDTSLIVFNISYSASGRTYSDCIPLNVAATIGNNVAHTTTQGNEIKNLSETLQDISINSL